MRICLAETPTTRCGQIYLYSTYVCNSNNESNCQGEIRKTSLGAPIWMPIVMLINNKLEKRAECWLVVTMCLARFKIVAKSQLAEGIVVASHMASLCFGETVASPSTHIPHRSCHRPLQP
eukprot:Gregarina_sp_Poly_1__4670@NODE_2496_length_2062_cov_12_575940_g1585_i0_p1_GENE_NODE_2496_length_2062_cov_12_575940_g1585_i0NODE_2496_length_2062_cov_12_575940_g1585_i0_p1_ORF_typecomplete_len120_score7_16_NODE_2496_length_2062_cov_12_575940_g1585_i013601719